MRHGKVMLAIVLVLAALGADATAQSRHVLRLSSPVFKAPSRSGPMGAGGQRSPCVTASRDPNPAPSARRVSRTARGGIRGVQDFGVVR